MTEEIRAGAGTDALYRFKREFRALVDMSDPNLVALYDLALGAPAPQQGRPLWSAPPAAGVCCYESARP